jgi:carbon monoxide dehydrogenase subunit G
MATGQASIDIDRPADAVWAVVSEFGGIAAWMPGIDTCRVEGDRRILDTMGMTITEELVKQDDAGRALTYSIVDGAPVDRHQAVVTVTPKGDGCHVTWDVDAEPDSMAELMTTIYQSSLDALRAHTEA